MANFKRKKTKRSVKCTMCTKYRWMGNNKGKRRVSDQRQLQDMEKSNGKNGAS